MKKKMLKTLKPGTLLLMVKNGSYGALCKKGDIVEFTRLFYDNEAKVYDLVVKVKYGCASYVVNRKDVELYNRGTGND